MNKKTQKICPKCGSSNIKWDFKNWYVVTTGQLDNYICLNCGYGGSFFPKIYKKKNKK